MNAPVRPITILIAALGGEGGGVLTNWIVAAAEKLGFPTQSTSIPGVAQRTGATTYYIEIVPVPWSALGGRRPVLALTPGIGDIDLMVASELMEAGRALAGGFITPDKTFLISSTSRSYLVVEKMAMADGRYDSERLLAALRDHARQSLFLDMEALSRESGAIVNSVMLGAIAGSGQLPLPAEAFEEAIREDAKGVEANLRGFRAGLEAARAGGAAAQEAKPEKRSRGASVADVEKEIASTIPAAARDIAGEGARRLAAYQDLAYVRLYLDRLRPICEADARAGADGRLARETARHLAVRMSFEDVIRVAQAKIDPARFRRIGEELGLKAGEPFAVAEFLKPGIEEFCSILPPRPARAIIGFSERRGWLGKAYVGMEVRTTSIAGFLRFWLLSKLRRWRPRSYRYQVEQKQIDAWLGLINDAARISAGLALEIAECARLIKGYGDTHKRGSENYRLIETRVIRPAIDGRYGARQGVDAIASARTAALSDPDGEALTRCIAEIEAKTSFKVAAE